MKDVVIIASINDVRIIKIYVQKCRDCPHYEEEDSSEETFYCGSLHKDIQVDAIKDDGFPVQCLGVKIINSSRL